MREDLGKEEVGVEGGCNSLHRDGHFLPCVLLEKSCVTMGCVCVCVCVSHSVVSDSRPLPWTTAGQVSRSMEFLEARILTLLICISSLFCECSDCRIFRENLSTTLGCVFLSPICYDNLP